MLDSNSREKDDEDDCTNEGRRVVVENESTSHDFNTWQQLDLKLLHAEET